MAILVRNIRLGLDEPEERILDLVAERLGVPVSSIRHHAIVRRSLDARRARSKAAPPGDGERTRSHEIQFCYHVEVALDEPRRAQRARLHRSGAKDAVWIEHEPRSGPAFGTAPLPERPVVIGFGPGGMFAALRLAQLGYKPIVLERGRDVRRRHVDVMQRFYQDRKLDPNSNLLFGEGGAGTYSDGKLYTRVSDPLCRYVLETFYQHGADPDILVDTRPHVGSDRLPTICTRIRRRIESLGGEVRFDQLVEDFRIEDRKKSGDRCITGIQVGGEWMSTGPVILALGHSARDTFRVLLSRGVQIVPKPFQIGVRIEHPQSMVDHWQYGTAAGHRRLASAEYHVVARRAAPNDGDMFSFCMCPGGMILPAQESRGLIATNGASRANRLGPFANSGLVITIDPQAAGFSGLDGIAYQERWERLAFETTEGSYRIPAQRATDFLAQRGSDGNLETSFPLGAQWADIRTIVPNEVSDALRHAMPILHRKFPGFAGEEAIITGPETRASAPIRILRDVESREAVDTGDLYPVGEGAGYAGGIVSSAVDGIKSADVVVRRFAPPA